MESVLQNLIRQRAESSRQTSRSNYSLSAICSVMFLCLFDIFKKTPTSLVLGMN